MEEKLPGRPGCGTIVSEHTDTSATGMPGAAYRGGSCTYRMEARLNGRSSDRSLKVARSKNNNLRPRTSLT